MKPDFERLAESEYAEAIVISTAASGMGMLDDIGGLPDDMRR